MRLPPFLRKEGSFGERCAFIAGKDARGPGYTISYCSFRALHENVVDKFYVELLDGKRLTTKIHEQGHEHTRTHTTKNESARTEAASKPAFSVSIANIAEGFTG